MVSASCSAAHGASLEETAALPGQHRERERSQLEYRKVPLCYHSVLLLIAFPSLAKVLVLGGSLCFAPMAPGAVQLCYHQPY